MKYFFLSLALAGMLCACFWCACSKDTSEETVVGIWRVTFDGSCSGTQDVVINNDGSFSFTVNCGTLVWTTSGAVSRTTGKVNGNINWGNLISCNGAFTGTLNKNNDTGSGTVSCFAVQIGWTARKI
jgi:hypothetical protein